jgi:hypothetical protein
MEAGSGLLVHGASFWSLAGSLYRVVTSVAFYAYAKFVSGRKYKNMHNYA